jgi:hypothetical protein
MKQILGKSRTNGNPFFDGNWVSLRVIGHLRPSTLVSRWAMSRIPALKVARIGKSLGGGVDQAKPKVLVCTCPEDSSV